MFLSPLLIQIVITTTRGVMVRTSAFIACHQCGFESRLELEFSGFSGFSMLHFLTLVVRGFSGYSGFLPTLIG